MSNGVSKPFFAGLLALFAREAGAGRERMIALVLDNAGWHTAPNRVVAEASLALCERGEVFHLADATHWVQHDKPAEVNRLMIPFLAA